MKSQLTFAAMMAASTRALDLTSKKNPMNLLAQTGLNALAADDCCCMAMPCLPTCNDACESDDEPQTQVEVELDVTEDVMEEVKPIGEDVIVEVGLEEALETVVDEEEA